MAVTSYLIIPVINNDVDKVIFTYAALYLSRKKSLARVLLNSFRGGGPSAHACALDD